MPNRPRLVLAVLLTLGILLPAHRSAAAETAEIRIAQQFGISYLPLTIMEKKGLLEAEGKKLGLDPKTEWVQFTGGAPMNDALISGSVDIVSGGVGPLLIIWGKTRTNLGVKGIAALNSMPLYLNTTNPTVKSVVDFTAKDKIALPAVKVSIQAVTLQMAAEKKYGEESGITVIATNGKPDAVVRMGRGEASGDEPTMVLVAAVPLSLHPAATRVANIGFGSGITSHTLLSSTRLQRLDTIEIEPVMVEAARRGFGARIHNVFEDPRSHVAYEDAKTFFAASHEPYDLIVSEPSNPWVSGVASLFSD